MLEQHLELLVRTRLVARRQFWGIDGYRYWDRRFPYLLLFEITSDPSTELEGILIHVLQRAQTEFPGQARI